MDYKTLSAEELVAALAEINEKAKAIFALESPTIEQADEAESLAQAKAAIEAVQAERAEAVKAAEAKFAAAKAAFAAEDSNADAEGGDAAGEDGDDADSDDADDADDADSDDADDSDSDDADGDDSADDADSVEAAEAEALAASAKHTKSQPIKNVKASAKKSTAKAVAKANKRPAVQEKSPVVITAAADVPGFATGSTLTGMEQVTKAAMGRVKAFDPWNKRSAQMQNKQSGGLPVLRKFGVAQFGVEFDSALLTPDQPSPTMELAAIKAALAEDRFTGTAAGWCAPSENVYSFIADYVVDGLVSVPEVGAPRGGLNITTGPRVGGESQGTNLDDFGFVQTEAQAEAQTVKPCETIVCPDFVDHRLDAVGYCFKIPFLTQKAYPELITDALRFANVLYAHKVNRYVINKMVGLSSAVSAMPYGASFTDTLEALTIIAIKERRKWNLGVNATMEVKVPQSAREIFRADMSRRNGLALSDVATDQKIEAEFSARKLAVEYVADWQELTGDDAIWPGSFDAMIYPAGTFIKAVEDVVNLSAVYDAASLSINEYTGVFFEQGILVAQAGYGSTLVQIPVCTAGVTGAAAFLCEGGSF